MLRTVIAVVLGSFVAAGLLFLMQALIASGQTAIVDKESTRIVDFVRVKREERLADARRDQEHEAQLAMLLRQRQVVYGLQIELHGRHRGTLQNQQGKGA